MSVKRVTFDPWVYISVFMYVYVGIFFSSKFSILYNTVLINMLINSFCEKQEKKKTECYILHYLIIDT